MPHKPRQFVRGEIYHIVIRRIAEEELFLDIDDHYRGIFCIYEFNNAKPVEILKRRRAIRRLKKKFKLKLGGGSPPTILQKLWSK